jgi:hypothetical protein
VRSWACDSDGDGSGCVGKETLPLLGCGYTSPRASASIALCCDSAFVGLPRFFLFAGSPADIMLEAYAGPPACMYSPLYGCGGRGCRSRPVGMGSWNGRFLEASGPAYMMGCAPAGIGGRR